MVELLGRAMLLELGLLATVGLLLMVGLPETVGLLVAEDLETPALEPAPVRAVLPVLCCER